jgi:hypothetical protein
VTSILRFVSYFTYDQTTKDPAYQLVPSLIFTVAEAGTYLLASCMPALPSLKRRWLGDRILTRSVKSLIAKRSKGTHGTGSHEPKLPDRNIMVERETRVGSEHEPNLHESPIHAQSGLHLNNAGFLKLEPSREFV